ncbi:diphthine--ammonia ligase [Roseivirga sp. BDSF3-8]|uniref:Dph6-related ATP pyrophosphatase n=1 Tax=Roseivirga sp. BDSF3-8 TaxID=3241598 RepID=UPI003531F793
MKISLSWSGGKDSAMALYRLLQSGQHHVVNLHCVVGEDTGQVPMHEVPVELIQKQAEAIGLPLKLIYMPSVRSNDAYRKTMEQFVKECLNEGIEALAYGDIFLEDLKAYRESMLHGSGLKTVFPLWKEPTGELIKEFVQSGFKTSLCAVNSKHLPESRLGETIDEEWISSLPKEIDPCGENGEYHSFTFDGPVFNHAVSFEKGPVYSQEYPDPEGSEAPVKIYFMPFFTGKEK